MSALILYMISANKTLAGKTHFVIPYLSVSELGKYISRLKNKKSSGLDGISNQLLKLSLQYIRESFTYVFNLCIEKNVSQKEITFSHRKSCKVNPYR